MAKRKPWSEKQRAAQSERLKQSWADRKARPKSFWKKLIERIRGAL